MNRTDLKLVTVTGLAGLLLAALLQTVSAQEPGREGTDRRKGDSRPRQQRELGPRSPSRGQRYSLEQAMSDQAQLHTIAFSGLAFLTGDFGACTFLPPGKVCDFFGFQYMRDIDSAGKGHNPMFLNRVAGNVLHILTPSQRELFADLAAEQATAMERLAQLRWPLIKAFCDNVAADRPANRELSRQAVVEHVGEIFERDAELIYRRAEVFGKVGVSLSDDQKAYLGKMEFGDFATWPDVDARPYRLRGGGGSVMLNVGYMTAASEFFSWYRGSLEADVYFCPERHGTYFGGFFMKDIPAMGKRDYNISKSLTGDSGRDFLTVLTEAQRRRITALPALHRKALREMADLRRAIATELRRFLRSETADKAKVVALGRRYGELDGEVSYDYARAFAEVSRTLTAGQRAELMRLRNLDDYKSAPAYIYSRPVEGTLPEMKTDRFFVESGK